jgi:hypothetical protein
LGEYLSDAELYVSGYDFESCRMAHLRRLGFKPMSMANRLACPSREDCKLGRTFFATTKRKAQGLKPRESSVCDGPTEVVPDT